MNHKIAFVANMPNIRAMRDISKVAEDSLPVISIFNTIEGEGLQIGTPRLFIRVAGCAVLCATCDTKYSWYIREEAYVQQRLGFNLTASSRLYSIPNLIRAAIDTGLGKVTSVTITGGEPLHYPKQIIQLITGLKSYGFSVNLETSGTILLEDIFQMVDIANVDIKTPSSGVPFEPQHAEMLCELALRNPNVQLKAVISDYEDFAYVVAHFNPILTNNAFLPIVLTPCVPSNFVGFDDKSNIIDIVNLLMEHNKGYNLRVIAQQHKFLAYDTHR